MKIGTVLNNSLTGNGIVTDKYVSIKDTSKMVLEVEIDNEKFLFYETEIEEAEKNKSRIY